VFSFFASGSRLPCCRCRVSPCLWLPPCFLRGDAWRKLWEASRVSHCDSSEHVDGFGGREYDTCAALFTLDIRRRALWRARGRRPRPSFVIDEASELACAGRQFPVIIHDMVGQPVNGALHLFFFFFFLFFSFWFHEARPGTLSPVDLRSICPTRFLSRFGPCFHSHDEPTPFLFVFSVFFYSPSADGRLTVQASGRFYMPLCGPFSEGVHRIFPLSLVLRLPTFGREKEQPSKGRCVSPFSWFSFFSFLFSVFFLLLSNSVSFHSPALSLLRLVLLVVRPVAIQVL
jgi:hypothetical protein